MTPHAYKKVKQRKPKRYNPVEAVKQCGDSWLFCDATYSLSSATRCALYEGTSVDFTDFLNMRDMERGLMPRVTE